MPSNPDRPYRDEIPLPLDPRWFDMLVDGELDEAHRREFLLRLDEVPDGWRRCAIAFLEEQSWRRECAEFLGELIQSPVDGDGAAELPGAATGPFAMTMPPAQSSAGRPARRARWFSGRPGTAMAMAASFLVALTLGWALQDMLDGDGGGLVDPGSLGTPQIAGGVAGPAASASDPSTAAPPIPGSRPAGSGSAPWETVTLVSDGDQRQRIELPARQHERLDSGWLQSLPTPMPPEVREALERMGRRVDHRRELVPVDMGDGRRLIVPVDEVEVNPLDDPGL